jgi:unsaturated rhamnogalacturonyl hydrolase
MNNPMKLPTLLLIAATAAGCAGVNSKPKNAAHFDAWPAGTSPQEVGKRVAERFVVAPHPNFGRTNPPNSITYPETCTWYGALTFAQLSGDKGLTRKLVARFEPLFGDEKKLIPRPAHVDATVFGSVPLELHLQTK